jgi:hypothetical protein
MTPSDKRFGGLPPLEAIVNSAVFSLMAMNYGVDKLDCAMQAIHRGLANRVGFPLRGRPASCKAQALWASMCAASI